MKEKLDKSKQQESILNQAILYESDSSSEGGLFDHAQTNQRFAAFAK